MPDQFPENLAPDSLAAVFAQRVATRDDPPPPPPPPSQTREAVEARVAAWLRATYDLRDQRSRGGLTQMVLLLLAQPEASTAALQAAAGLGLRMASKAASRLVALGLTRDYYVGRTRCHRLTRAAEDALLPVVTGVGG